MYFFLLVCMRIVWRQNIVWWFEKNSPVCTLILIFPIDGDYSHFLKKIKRRMKRQKLIISIFNESIYIWMLSNKSHCCKKISFIKSDLFRITCNIQLNTILQNSFNKSLANWDIKPKAFEVIKLSQLNSSFFKTIRFLTRLLIKIDAWLIIFFEKGKRSF